MRKSNHKKPAAVLAALALTTALLAVPNLLALLALSGVVVAIDRK